MPPPIATSRPAHTDLEGAFSEYLLCKDAWTNLESDISKSEQRRSRLQKAISNNESAVTLRELRSEPMPSANYIREVAIAFEMRRKELLEQYPGVHKMAGEFLEDWKAKWKANKVLGGISYTMSPGTEENEVRGDQVSASNNSHDTCENWSKADTTAWLHEQGDYTKSLLKDPSKGSRSFWLNDVITCPVS